VLDEPIYLEDRVVLRLTGDLNKAWALWAQREVELAITHYRYRTVAIHICSPGGELSALDGLLGEMRYWTDEVGARFETKAIGDVASAAAVLLAMGTIPYRAATRSSCILLHEPRIHVNSSRGVWTRSDVATVGFALERASQRLLDELSEHIWLGRSNTVAIRSPAGESGKATPIRSATDLRTYYQDLQREERWLTADAALELGLIDSITAPVRGHPAAHAEDNCGRTS